ncbi:MAG: tRNA pseudouridine(55) synthase TruB [Phycisphaeraceae bacterium]
MDQDRQEHGANRGRRGRRGGGGATALCGLLVVDKPMGLSSMDVVRRVRRAAGGVKTGHAGTLDPLATGVVICCLGRATKVVERLMGLAKRYETVVDLSAFTSTDDAEGEREVVEVAQVPGRGAVEAVCARFVGEIEQVPPAHSAVKVEGRRAYKAARRGEALELKARVVRVDAIEVVDYQWPRLTLRVDCGRGTYIRSLGRDIGRALGTGGYLASLRRTAVGPYTVERAVSIERCASTIGEGDLLPMPD